MFHFWSRLFQLWISKYPLLQLGMSVKKRKQNGKQSRSWWNCSLWAISSRCKLFAKVLALVSRAEWVNLWLMYLLRRLLKRSPLTLSALRTKTKNNHHDETANNVPSHLDLHCLPFCFIFNWDHYSENGSDQSQRNQSGLHFRNSRMKGLNKLKLFLTVKLSKRSFP